MSFSHHVNGKKLSERRKVLDKYEDHTIIIPVVFDNHGSKVNCLFFAGIENSELDNELTLGNMTNSFDEFVGSS